VSARVARLTLGAGLLVMLGAGVVASRFTPFWFDPDEGCALHGRCVTPASEAVLQLTWWPAGGGFVLALAGLVMMWRQLPASGSPPRLPVVGHAAAALVAGPVLTAVVGIVAIAAVLAAEQFVPLVLCVLWLAQAYVVGAFGAQTRRGWLIGLLAGAFATAAVVMLLNKRIDTRLLLLADGAVLAATVLVGRALPAPGERLHAPRAAAAGTVGVLVAAAIVVLTFDPVGPGEARTPAAPAPAPAPAPPSASPSPPPVPAPLPTVAPVPPPQAADLCDPADLAWSTTGWDAAMGSRAVTVVAAVQGTEPCFVDGFVDVVIAQGGRPLQLVSRTGFAAASTEPAPAQRVGIAPGGTAVFTLYWEGYGAAADGETPQSLRVALAGSAEPVEVPIGPEPAPFDLVDGGTIEIGPWQPGPP
jgi:hypothetical protein